VKAVSANYPLRGRLEISTVPFAQERADIAIAKGVPAPGQSWIDSRLVALLGLKLGDKIAVGLDVRGTTLRGRGWTRDGGDLYETLARLEKEGCARYVVTDIAKDGTLQGPNLELLRNVCAATACRTLRSSFAPCSTIATRRFDGFLRPPVAICFTTQQGIMRFSLSRPNRRQTNRARRLYLFGLLVLPFLLLFSAAGRSTPAPRRVLLLHSLEHESVPFSVFEEAFRRYIGKQSPEGVQFFEVSLQNHEGGDQEAVLGYALSRFGKQSPDLIMPIGGPAAKFAQKYRSRLFPSTPMLMAAVDHRHLARCGAGLSRR